MLDILNNLVNKIIDESKPYRKEVEFLKIEGDSVVFMLDGKKQRINQRFIYAAIGHLSVGDKFDIDSRYIHTL